MSSQAHTLLRAVVNHIVLPPDIPGSSDRDAHEINQDLLFRLQIACNELSEATEGRFKQVLDHLSTSLIYCQSLHSSQYLDKTCLQRVFRQLGNGEILIIHVTKQNSGLLVRRGTKYVSPQVFLVHKADIIAGTSAAMSFSRLLKPLLNQQMS